MGNQFQFFRLVAMVFTFTACGPMNTKPADSSRNSPQSKNPSLGVKDETKVPHYVLSDAQKFLLEIEAEAGSSVVPVIGDNVASQFNRYSIYVAKAQPITALKNAKLEVEYFNQKSKTQRKFNAPVKLFPDGHFETVFTFKHRGTWEIHYQLSDGALKDEFTEILDLNSTAE